MKIIRPKDTQRIAAEKVQPGDVLLEGVVLSVELDGMHLFYETRFGSVCASRLDTVQVFARLGSPEMVDACKLATMIGVMPVLDGEAI